MLQYALPVVFTLFLWWFSTGVILYLNGLPRWTYKWTMGSATLLLVLAFVGLYATRDDTRLTGAYLAFVCGLVVWGWQEVAFLLGYVTGPRRTPCPEGAGGWRRTGYALQTVLHHELGLIGLAMVVTAMTWNAGNGTGFWTFMILWGMRQSAKLNVFLGVRNLSEDFLPTHLKYLQSYFRRAPMNALFPFSVALSLLAAVPLWQAALADGASAYDVTSLTLLASLLTLGLVEHGFMVLPLPSQALWNWGLRSRDTAPAEGLGTKPV